MDDPASNAHMELSQELAPTNNSNISLFLSLPAEMRIKIYKLLVVGRIDPRHMTALHNGDTHCKINLTVPVRTRELRVLHPAILRTCRQIYNEAIPLMYSDNLFFTSKAETLMDFHATRQPDLFARIRSLDLILETDAQLDLWLQQLDMLKANATGLRHLYIGWHAKYAIDMANGPGFINFGLGANVMFVNALASIRGLQTLTLQGFYPPKWPAFLSEKMGITVQERRTFLNKKGHLEGTAVWEQKRASYERRFAIYQHVTKNISPWTN